MTRLPPRWWVVVLVCVPVVLGAFSGAFRHTYDAWVHVFFADHYLRGWFELWEPRWYGGFSVLSYPPLAHQLVAIASVPFGVEVGFPIVMGGAMLAIPFAAGSFGRAVLGESSARWAPVMLALWPTSHRFAYVYGQLPTLLASSIALFAMAMLKRFLDEGRWRQLLLMSLLVGTTAATHHVSTIFAAMGCGIVGLAQLGVTPRAQLPKVLVRAVLAGACAAGAIVLTIWPFWQFAALPPQAEIPHISREAIWARPFGLEVLEQLTILAVGAAASGYALLRYRRAAGLALGVTFFALLSMGMTTPLPQLLFRSQARWLTYDKFHHWAAVWFCVLVAPLAARIPQKVLLVLVALAMPLSLYEVSHKESLHSQPEYLSDLTNELQVLNGPDAAKYAHLTLGFGDQLCRLDVFGASPDIDGDYHTARSDPGLRASGIGSLDASKYYPQGKDVLAPVLARAPQSGLRWVLVNDSYYYEQVMAAGFELRDVWADGVTLFERRDVSPIVPHVPNATPERYGLWWGLVPLTVFSLALLFTLLEFLHQRDRNRGER